VVVVVASVLAVVAGTVVVVVVAAVVVGAAVVAAAKAAVVVLASSPHPATDNTNTLATSIRFTHPPSKFHYFTRAHYRSCATMRVVGYWGFPLVSSDCNHSTISSHRNQYRRAPGSPKGGDTSLADQDLHRLDGREAQHLGDRAESMTVG
jgi:hypothetical protein